SAELVAPQGLEYLRVMVVDDNESAREIMASIFSHLDIQVTLRPGGAASLIELELAQKKGRPYHFVFMDWFMPGMDGIEAVRRIRAMESISETLTVVMVTAYSRDELMEKSKGIRLDGILEKPVNVSQVNDTIQRALQLKTQPVVSDPIKRVNIDACVEKIRGRKVLLVEDNEVNQELATDILVEAGVIVELAKNGVEAIAKVEKNTYDVILMDWHMPIMDGFEATRIIRSREEFANLPILAMTANAMAGDREKCLSVGMNDHIAKPIDVENFLSTVARWMTPKIHPVVNDDLTLQNSSKLALWPELAGVDSAGPRQRLRGNVAQYRKLLKRFMQNQMQADQRIRSQIDANDLQAAQHHAHTLKGLAANIGAEQLTVAARALEHALQSRELEELDRLLLEVAEPLNRLVKTISDLEGVSDEAQIGALGELGNREIDEKLLTAQLHELAQLLADDDSSAVKLATTILPLLKSSRERNEQGNAFEIVIKYVEEYDFQAALLALQAFLDSGD
ncbi:MAG: response regulator, partial [Undibacterium sp.]|nr:response regulator [Undibacterium sp.]